jgi:hypothetical protein
MRHFITVTTFCLLAACTFDKQNNNAATVSGTKGHEYKTKKRQTTKDYLVGDWAIYNTSDGTMTTFCNACPTMTFFESGTAKIMFPDGSKETIKWTKEKHTLTIVNVTNKKKNREFSDGQYSLTFDNKDRLEIKGIGTSYTYGLSRH